MILELGESQPRQFVTYLTQTNEQKSCNFLCLAEKMRLKNKIKNAKLVRTVENSVEVQTFVPKSLRN